MTPRGRDSALTLLACGWGFGAATTAWPAALRLDAGERVAPWTWVVVGVFLVAAAVSCWWEDLWRALHPPTRFDPATLPPSFDWGEVARRMRAYQDTGGVEDSPEESDSVYLMIRDAVTLEYVDVVREILSRYDG